MLSSLRYKVMGTERNSGRRSSAISYKRRGQGTVYNVSVPIRGKLISEISPAEIFDLIKESTPEDASLEFRGELLDPRKPEKKRNEEKEDWVADLVAFANAHGGHIIIGLEADKQERAARLKPMLGDQAKTLADTLRNVASDRGWPPIQHEIREFRMSGEEWIVIAHVPDSQYKPHMYSYQGRTRFAVRDGNRKREMRYEEIQRLFVSGPQQQMMVRFLSEIESISSRLGDLERMLRKGE